MKFRFEISLRIEEYSIGFDSSVDYKFFNFNGFDDFGYPLFWFAFYGFLFRSQGHWLDEIPF